MTSPAGDCCCLSFKSREEDEKEIQDACASLAAVQEVTMDAAAAAALSELHDISRIKKKITKNNTKGFSHRTTYFHVNMLPIGRLKL